MTFYEEIRDSTRKMIITPIDPFWITRRELNTLYDHYGREEVDKWIKGQGFMVIEND